MNTGMAITGKPVQGCSQHMNCAACEHYQKEVFKYREYPAGMKIPKERCSRNIIYFLQRGAIRVDSEEHAGVVLRAGQFLLQPIASFVSFEILEDAACILYLFDQPETTCRDRLEEVRRLSETSVPVSDVLPVYPPLAVFLESIKVYFSGDLLCNTLLVAKETELGCLLTCYYSIEELVALYSHVFKKNAKFQYFVLHHYQQVKDVEAFAQLAGLNVSTFRRIFRDVFGEPVYQWMLKKRKEDVLHDLLTTDLTISEVGLKYGFESLANFSHFCRTNFGLSPRNLRKELKKDCSA